MTEWRVCRLHPDVNPDTMWGCPDCLAELLHRERQDMGSYIFRNIDPDLWHQVKVRCAYDRITIKALVEQLLREWLERHGTVGPTASK